MNMAGPKKILVTGANGFIGSAMFRRLASRGVPVRGVVRDPAAMSTIPGLDDLAAVGSMGAGVDWQPVLKDVKVVLHLAARAHIMKDTVKDPLAAFRLVNTEGAVKLARQASECGVRRLVFVSTIKVNGETSGPDNPFTPHDIPRPSDPYAISKQEAENALWEISTRSGMEVVVVRPPLVYGPGVKGNFLRLLSWVDRGTPLPLGAVDNRRSLIGLGNLVDFLERCIGHPDAAGETFLVSDGHDLSTPGIIELMARSFGKKPRLAKIPVPVLQTLARVAGKSKEWDRLCGSLVVDSTHARRKLDWEPPVSVQTGFNETADWFHRRQIKG